MSFPIRCSSRPFVVASKDSAEYNNPATRGLYCGPGFPRQDILEEARMATVKAEGKSAFLKEFFVDHPEAGEAAINAAWRAGGHDDSISGSLIYKVRANLGLKTKGRSRSKATQAVGAGKRSSGAAKSNGRGTGSEVGGRTTAKANVRTTTVSSEPPAKALATGKDRCECSSFWRARSTTCSTRSGWREDFRNSRRLCGKLGGSWSVLTRSDPAPRKDRHVR